MRREKGSELKRDEEPKQMFKNKPEALGYNIPVFIEPVYNNHYSPDIRKYQVVNEEVRC